LKTINLAVLPAGKSSPKKGEVVKRAEIEIPCNRRREKALKSEGETKTA